MPWQNAACDTLNVEELDLSVVRSKVVSVLAKTTVLQKYKKHFPHW